MWLPIRRTHAMSVAGEGSSPRTCLSQRSVSYLRATFASASAQASPELSRRVKKVVSYLPLSGLADQRRGEFHEALLEAATFEDLPGKWQAAILRQSRTGGSCASSAATNYAVRANDPRVAGSTRPPRVFSFADMQAFVAKGGASEPMLRVFTDCGLRLGEVAA
jgi:hypothetical protein